MGFDASPEEPRNAKAKANNRVVYHHTCGHVTPIIPDLIDIGLDIRHPTQHTLTTGGPNEVRAEVRRLQAEMGIDGGFILETGKRYRPMFRLKILLH